MIHHSVETNPETGETVGPGMGELHLMSFDRMKREFKVEANVGAPQVSFNIRNIPRFLHVNVILQNVNLVKYWVCDVWIELPKREEGKGSEF